MSGLWGSLEATAYAAFVRESAWAYPILETVHLIGIATLVGSNLVLSLRFLGVSPSLSAQSTLHHIFPWAWGGFGLILLSGLSMFASDATAFAANISFRVKMVLILLSGANMLAFQLGAARTIGSWDLDPRPPLSARVAGGASIVLWLGVITAGRMIAYID